MKKISLLVAVMSGQIVITGCAPSTDPAAIYERSPWPNSDQTLSASERAEIEAGLKRLGYFRGTVDGLITKDTRKAVREYQSDIGAPENGIVSGKLLNNLRRAQQDVAIAAPATASSVTLSPKKSTTTSNRSAQTTSGEGGGEGGGSGGGAGGSGGAWN